MKNSSSIEILRTFSEDELKEFTDFVSSPFFNKKKSALTLFRQIRKFYPKFDDDKLHREILWKSVYPKKKYNYGVMKNLIYDLNKLSEKYLEINYQSKNILANNCCLAESFMNRSLNKLFLSKVKQIDNYITEKKYTEEIEAGLPEIYNNMSFAKMLESGFHKRNSPGTDIDLVLTNQAEYLLSAYLIKSFYICFNCKVQGNFKNSGTNDNIIQEFISEVMKNKIIERILDKPNSENNEVLKFLKLNLLMYKSIFNCDNKSYREFKEFFFTNNFDLPYNDTNIIYQGMRISMDFLEEKNVNFNREMNDLNKIYFEYTYAKTMKFTVVLILKSIYHASLEDDSEFIRKIIDRYIPKLHSEHKENLLIFAVANQHFIEKNFNKSLESLSKVKADFFNMKNYIRTLEIMNYYELEDYNALAYCLDSFLHFINNNRGALIEQRKTQLKNFCKLISGMIKIRENNSSEDLLNMKNDIPEMKVMQKEWFIKKLNELELKFTIPSINSSKLK